VEVSVTLATRRAVLFVFSAAIAAALLAACGGGGGTGITPPSIPRPQGSPDPYPTAAGDTFTYSGTLTQTYTLYGTPAPVTPAPTATPWVTTAQESVTQNVSVTDGASFNGVSGLADFTTHETDAGQHATTTVTADEYLSFASDPLRANGVDVTEAGATSTDSNGVALETDVGGGNGILAELPEVPEARWTDSAARKQTETDPDGQATVATYNSDGSYDESVSYPEGGTATVQANADGSGVYSLPLEGDTAQPSSVTVNAPSGGQIQVSYAIYTGLSFPEAGGFSIPVWYPQVPPVLASDTYVDEGPASLPAACGVPGEYTSSGSIEKLAEVKTRLDTVFGELETDDVTSYVSNRYGVLCVVIADDLQNFYDYSVQSNAILSFNNAPLYETLVNETLALESEHLSPASISEQSPQAEAAATFALPSFARVRGIIARARIRRERLIFARLQSKVSP
jgi:hypothetical protein